MRQKLLRSVSTIALIVIVIISIYKVTKLLDDNESYIRYASFFNEKQQIDVLFIGFSHVRYAFFPMELWQEYGISSYNLAGDGSSIPISYWALVNALDYQYPKVVVLDVYVFEPGQLFDTWGQVHNQFDAFPISYNKLKMIKDLFNNDNLIDAYGNAVNDKGWDLLWNLGTYHTKWSDLEKDDFVTDLELIDRSKAWKGAGALGNVSVGNDENYDIIEEQVEYDDLSREYLERIIKLCREREIELLLINTGYNCNAEAKLFADSVNQIAEDNGLKYLDFTKKDIINLKTDRSSKGHNTHLNFSGAERLTKYIGNYLVNNYTLKDYRESEDYDKWWEDYDAFVKSKQSMLLAQTDIDRFMIFLNDDDYKVIYEIRDNSILSEKIVGDLLANMGIDATQGYNLIVSDMESDQYNYISNTYEEGTEWSTVAGKLAFCIDEDGDFGMYIDGNELYKIDNADEDCKIKITVISKYTNDIVCVCSF